MSLTFFESLFNDSNARIIMNRRRKLSFFIKMILKMVEKQQIDIKIIWSGRYPKTFGLPLNLDDDDRNRMSYPKLLQIDP